MAMAFKCHLIEGFNLKSIFSCERMIIFLYSSMDIIKLREEVNPQDGDSNCMFRSILCLAQLHKFLFHNHDSDDLLIDTAGP